MSGVALPSPDFSSGGTNTPSASFAQPLSQNNLWSSVLDPAIHNALGLNGQDLSKGQYAPPAYASGPNQNYSPAPNYSSASSSVPSQFNQPGGFGDPNHPDLSNPYKQNLYNQFQQYMSSQQGAAASQASANIAAATNMYNNLRSQLETQRPVLESAYNKGLADLQSQLDLGQQQGQANSAQLTSSYNTGMGQLGQQYQQSQADNRELARAMGGNGSDYAQLQNRTNNAYQTNQFNTFNDYQSRLSQINQGMQSLQNWGSAQKDNLATQYQQGINQLVLNEDMTDFSKAQAIQQIQADYQKNVAGVNATVMQLGGQLAIAQQQTQQIMAMYGKATGGYDPTAGLAGMFFGAAGTQAPTVDASGGINYPTQNKTAGGINTNQNVLGA